MRRVEKFAYLGSIDHMWIDHIDSIDGLREGVRLRGYAQRDPVAEFKNEAYQMFEGLIDRIDDELSRRIFRVGVTRAPQPEIPLEEAKTNVDQLDKTGLTAGMGEELTAAAGTPAFSESSTPQAPKTAKKSKVGRNEPCPCGAVNPNTGKPYKYKKCGLINAPHHKG
jgi:preprotein translocase subunit SecA